MENLFLSMVIGLAAGIIDIIPMIARKMERRAIVSAFLQYFFVSVVIVNIDLPGLPWWIEGSLISLALAAPVIVIVAGEDKKAAPVIAAMAIILGGLIGIAGHLLK